MPPRWLLLVAQGLLRASWNIVRVRITRARCQDRHFAASPSRQTLPLDIERCKLRHLIENLFCKLIRFKRIVMRADKADTGFNAFIHLAATVMNTKLFLAGGLRISMLSLVAAAMRYTILRRA
jgi:hypothetical protein